MCTCADAVDRRPSASRSGRSAADALQASKRRRRSWRILHPASCVLAAGVVAQGAGRRAQRAKRCHVPLWYQRGWVAGVAGVAPLSPCYCILQPCSPHRVTAPLIAERTVQVQIQPSASAALVQSAVPALHPCDCATALGALARWPRGLVSDGAPAQRRSARSVRSGRHRAPSQLYHVRRDAHAEEGSMCPRLRLRALGELALESVNCTLHTPGSPEPPAPAPATGWGCARSPRPALVSGLVISSRHALVPLSPGSPGSPAMDCCAGAGGCQMRTRRFGRCRNRARAACARCLPAPLAAAQRTSPPSTQAGRCAVSWVAL